MYQLYVQPADLGHLFSHYACNGWNYGQEGWFFPSHTSNYSDDKILSIVREVFDCRPGMIIKNFSLTNPTFKYHELTNYGHFGRPDLDLPWEKLDKVEEIKKLL